MSGHYASQCPNKKKGKNQSQQVAASAESQVKEFAKKFEKDFSLVSCLSSTDSSSAWFVDSGDSRYMMRTHELFTSWSKMDSNMHVELGTHVRCGVEEVGTIRFQLESRGFLEVADVLYVPEIRRNLLSISALEYKGYVVLFQNGQVFMQSERASADTTVNIGVKEGRVYRLQGKPVGRSKGILDHGLMLVTKDPEQEALKGEQSS
jgi:hypothetical protein